MRCTNCGEYFKRSRWNKTDFCQPCYDEVEDHKPIDIDEESMVDLELLKNPSCKTQAVFYD